MNLEKLREEYETIKIYLANREKELAMTFDEWVLFWSNQKIDIEDDWVLSRRDKRFQYTCTNTYLMPIKRPAIDDREEILRNIEIDENDCWVWKGTVAEVGYNKQKRPIAKKLVNNKEKKSHQKVVYATRLAWETFVGEIPEGLGVFHTCDNKLCVNPDHLKPMTQKESHKRIDEKLGLWRGNKKVGKKRVYLTPEIYERILTAGPEVTNQELSDELGISPMRVSRYRSGYYAPPKYLRGILAKRGFKV